MKKISLLYPFILLAGILLVFSCTDEEESIQIEFAASNTKVMAGEKVVFDDRSTGHVSAWDWTFEGGTPETSQLSQPEVTYDKVGEFTVTLRVQDRNGVVSMTKEKYIVVGNSPVTADFSSSTQNTMNDTPVKFTDLSTGSVANWKWTFTPETGTPITSTEQNPEIIFAQPGVYSIKLEVSNPEYSDVKTVDNYLTVIDASNVIAEFTSNRQTTYEGGKVLFADKSLGRITAWLWEFEGANISSSTEQNPEVTFTKAGRYKVSLRASNGGLNNTAVKQNYITVIPGANLSVFFPFDGVLEDAQSESITAMVEKPSDSNITFETLNRWNEPGKAVYFDGSGGFIVKDHDAFNLGTSDYTISVWLKIAEAQKTTIMVPWQESGGGGTGDNQTWLRHYSTATNQLTFATEDGAGGSTNHLTAANSPAVHNIANGQWRHVVCVREGLKTSIYIDGVFTRSVNSGNGIKNVSNAGNFKIGWQESGASYRNRYIGAMDDLIIYRRVLTDQEIVELKGL